MATKVLVAASTKPILLSILIHGENYGYQIIKEVERLSGGTLQWTDAMLYPVLHRMEREALIQSRWIKKEGGRKRKYYSITQEGEASLEMEREQWESVNNVFQVLWSGGEQNTGLSKI